MVSTLGMTNSWKCPPALTDSDSRYYSCSDETSRSGFQRPACFLCAGAGVAPGAARSVGRDRRGRWWAEIEASEAASGSWTLLDDSNRIVLEGTWSARRVNAPAKLTVPHWQGTWTARAGAGRALYGTWQADLAGFSGKTFEDMLKRAVEQQVSGSWRSGRAHGNWWLQGSKW